MIRDWGWVPHVVSLEIRKIISYRVDFWVSFLAGVLIELAVAYFLWAAVFTHLGAEKIGGYTFQAMMVYFLLVPLVTRTVQVQALGFISQEIYEGGLTRYLVYPVPFFPYKYLQHLAQSLVCGAQLSLCLGIVAVAFGTIPDVELGWESYARGMLACLLAGYLYLAIVAILEMVAFWADNVWSLAVILRLTTGLLGGGIIPLSLFPEWAQTALMVSPFPYLLSFPVRAFLGRMDAERWWLEAGMTVAWSIVFSLVAWFVWKRGTRQYSGVGI